MAKTLANRGASPANSKARNTPSSTKVWVKETPPYFQSWEKKLPLGLLFFEVSVAAPSAGMVSDVAFIGSASAVSSTLSLFAIALLYPKALWES